MLQLCWSPTMFRPMLATNMDVKLLKYPLLCSFKLDGVRAIVRQGVLLSRTLKPIPNYRVQEKFALPEYEGWDGELVMLNSETDVDPDCYRNTVSTVMTRDTPIEGVQWKVFDNTSQPNEPYIHRWESVSSLRLDNTVIYDEASLFDLSAKALLMGYEGLILRSPVASYKFGRSTVREGGMLKLKQFLDDEACVVGLTPMEHNDNIATLNELGYTKHSHHKAGKITLNTLGSLDVTWHGLSLQIGSGFTQSERDNIWMNPHKFIGQIVKFKYFPLGMKTLPRHPIFLGWRHKIDYEPRTE